MLLPLGITGGKGECSLDPCGGGLVPFGQSRQTDLPPRTLPPSRCIPPLPRGALHSLGAPSLRPALLVLALRASPLSSRSSRLGAAGWKSKTSSSARKFGPRTSPVLGHR